jgi:hypothetical protein
VAVVSAAEDGTIIHDSCHLTVAEAEAWIGQMDNPDVDLTDEALPPEMPEVATNSAAPAGYVNREAMLSAMLAGAMSELGVDPVSTETEDTVSFGAIPSHSSSLSEDSFSSPAAKATRIISPNSEEYFARIFAWRDTNANTQVKSSYKFRHHFVEEDGTPGPASRIACSGGISVLNGGGAGTTIPEADRQRVYDHLAMHLRDAGRDVIELLSQEDYMVALAKSNEMKAQSAEFGAIASHSTPVGDQRFVGPSASEVRIISPNSEDYFADFYAWRDDARDTSVKGSYKFFHHFVSDTGVSISASRVACSSGIGILNGARGGSTIPLVDRQGVYDHLARHLRDDQRIAPKLLSQDDYEVALMAANTELANTNQKAWDADMETTSSSTEVFDMHEDEVMEDQLETDQLEPVELEEGEIVVTDGDMSGLSDDELMAELARRWAEKTIENLSAERPAEFDNPLLEVEVEVIQIETEIECECGEGECECGKDKKEGGYGKESDDEIVVTLPAGTCITIEAAEEEEEDHKGKDGMGGEGGPMMLMATDGVTLADEPQMVDTPVSLYDWEGVLIVEGLASGDGRKIAENALTWRELPLPLMLQTANASGHDGAVIAGSIHEIERQGQNIVGRGFFDSGTAGVEAHRLLEEGTMRGVSADIDSVKIEFMTDDGASVSAEDMMFGGVDALEVLVAGRLMGATLTPFPAFQEAFVTVLIGEEVEVDVTLVASGADTLGDVWRVPSPLGVWPSGKGDAEQGLASLVASAAASVEVPTNPPMDWFLPGKMTSIEPFTVHPDGRCYGLVAAWGSCHIGFADRCVPVPKSGCAYKHFRNKNVLTAEGTLVATGPIYMDTVHPNLRLVASDSQAFYADTGCGVADVALYENEFGIVAAGALRPGLSAEQVRKFRGSDVSPDWRQLGGRLEVVGLLSVNVSGFIVEGLVASGAEVSAPRGVWDSVAGEVTALVAAGMIHTADTEKSDLRRELDSIRVELSEFREALRPVRAAAAAAKFAALSPAGDVESGCSCDTGH